VTQGLVPQPTGKAHTTIQGVTVNSHEKPFVVCGCTEDMGTCKQAAACRPAACRVAGTSSLHPTLCGLLLRRLLLEQSSGGMQMIDVKLVSASVGPD
jgi:hypothetical protein